MPSLPQRLLMLSCRPLSSIPTPAQWEGMVNERINKLNNVLNSMKYDAPPSLYSGFSPHSAYGAEEDVDYEDFYTKRFGRVGGNLTYPAVVKRNIEKFHSANLRTAKSKSDVKEAILGTLIVNIYTVTAQFLHCIKRNRAARTNEDCILFQLYRAVHLAAADEFGRLFGVPAHLIDSHLRDKAITMTDHGYHIDQDLEADKETLIYLTDEKALAYRLEIDNGKFWLRNLGAGPDEFKLADCTDTKYREASNTAYDPSAHGPVVPNGHGVFGYAMGVNRKIYAKDHVADDTNKEYRFHSAYLSGNEVLCTGCLTIVDGELTYIDNSSGHYAPSIQQLKLAVEALVALGINADRVTVGCLNPKTYEIATAPAAKFLKDWELHLGDNNSPQRYHATARRIREALAKYEKRAKGIFSRPSQTSLNALYNLKGIQDDERLVRAARYLVGELGEGRKNFQKPIFGKEYSGMHANKASPLRRGKLKSLLETALKDFKVKREGVG